MTKRFTQSTVSTLIAIGVVATALSGVVAPATAAAKSIPHWVGTGIVHVQDGVRLGEGRILERAGKVLVDLEKDGIGRPKLVARWLVQAPNEAASAVFPVLRDGAASDYYVLARITTGSVFGLNARAECEVFYGVPGHGGNVVVGAPFRCDTTRRGLDNDWDFMVRPSA